MTQENNINLLAEQNTKLDSAVKDALKNKIEETRNIKLSKSSDYHLIVIINQISAALDNLGYRSDKLKIGRPTLKNQSTESIDLAFNIAALLPQSNKSVGEITQEIIENLSGLDLISSVEATGNFINMKLDYSKFGLDALKQITKLGDKYGQFRDNEPLVIIIDFSSTNIAKNMTAAHLRSTIIGQALVNIHSASGNIPFGINHLGDWGTQFGNIIYEYSQEVEKNKEVFLKELESDPTGTLMRIYRQFNEKRENDPESVKKAQQIFLELENGNPEYVGLWDKFKTWSLEEFEPIYDRLGIKFDAVQGESFYEDKMTDVVIEAVDKKVLKVDEQGAVVFPSQPLTDPSTGVVNTKVMLDEDNQPRDEIILKPSGGSVYLTRDLAAIKYRGVDLKADKLLYVIGKEQKSHFLMLFTMADQLKYIKLGDGEHISFGHLNVGGQKMKSRSGEIILLNDLLDQSVDAAANMLLERTGTKHLTEVEKSIAEQVGIGSVIFNDLKQNREKDIEFVPDQAKALEAGSAAYIQYANARANSVIKKVGLPKDLQSIPSSISQVEKSLIIELSEMPLVIKEAADTNAPHKIANYLTSLSQLFNAFYTDHSVARADTSEIQNFRLTIVNSVIQVLQNSAALLQLPLPETM